MLLWRAAEAEVEAVAPSTDATVEAEVALYERYRAAAEAGAEEEAEAEAGAAAEAQLDKLEKLDELQQLDGLVQLEADAEAEAEAEVAGEEAEAEAVAAGAGAEAAVEDSVFSPPHSDQQHAARESAVEPEPAVASPASAQQRLLSLMKEAEALEVVGEFVRAIDKCASPGRV
jgi:hypothetical protein